MQLTTKIYHPFALFQGLNKGYTLAKWESTPKQKGMLYRKEVDPIPECNKKKSPA